MNSRYLEDVCVKPYKGYYNPCNELVIKPTKPKNAFASSPVGVRHKAISFMVSAGIIS